MFAKTIIDSDSFLDMALSTQALYFHLSMRADDDGFINSPKKISKMIGASDDELKILLAKKFIIGFESGIVVIKHWKIHNYIQKDRYKPTNYSEEKALLNQKDNFVYTLDTECIQDVRVGKVSKGKVSLELGKSNKEIFFSNEILNNLFIEYLQLRKQLKCSNSQTVINRLLKKLNDFELKGFSKNEIIENSIVGSWKDFYEPKRNNQPHQPYNTPKSQVLNTNVNIWDEIDKQESMKNQGLVDG